MLTADQINALVQLANRAPKSPAEALWLAALVEQINAALAAKDSPDNLPA